MKLWINKRVGLYNGGMILVAANSAEEAHEAFHEWDINQELWCIDFDGAVDDFCYKPENWKEVPYSYYTLTTPRVLSESGYPAANLD